MSEILFQVTIPGRPRILKNHKKLIRVKGRTIPISSDIYRKWAIFAAMFIRRAKKCPTIDFPVIAEATFYLKNHQHEFDVGNGAEGLWDILEDEEVLKNDKLIYDLHCRKIFDQEIEKIEVVVKRL